MKKIFSQSLPAWILLIVVAGLLAAQTATLIIAARGVSDTGRSFDLFRLGERTVALSRAFYTEPPEVRRTLLSELANSSLTLSMSSQPAVESAIAADDELAELEDILVGKLTRNGVSDIRIREEDPSNIVRSPSGRTSGPEDEPGKVEKQLIEAASNLGKSGRFIVSVQFNDGQWLNFITPVTPNPQVLTRENMPLYMGAAMFIILLSLWAIRQLTGPYAALERAVRAIGHDLNRPPLPEVGSREVRTAAHAVNWMQKKLQDYVSEREHLAAALAHDLRTPITRLRLRFELLRKRKDVTALAADLAEIETIIQSVVDFASHELSDEPKERIDLVSLVEAVCDDFPQARLDPASARSRIVCNGRPVALKRCIINLIDNAIKYGKRASVALKVRTDMIDVIIEDEGQRIPEAEIEHVFQPFRRLERSRNRDTGGIGLGLAIARSIARAHAGDVHIHNRADVGMCVVLSLPTIANFPSQRMPSDQVATPA